MPRRWVRVESVRLRFAAAHMATFRGDCEPLHGHNYELRVEAHGELTEDSWVQDFGLLKAIAREICEELDHRFLLQRGSRILQIVEHEDQWEVWFGVRPHYWLPKADVLALPVDNTTSERLAEWICGRLRGRLDGEGVANVQRLRVGVEEMPGQSGWYEEDER